MNYLLDNVPTEQQSPYGCWNKERPLNGVPVHHNHGDVVVAVTVWKGSVAGEALPCHYGEHYGNTDGMCCGCKHVKDVK